MITNGALRTIVPQISRRCYASAVAHGHAHGKDVHPLFNDHPVAPVATYDDWPVPVLSFKEGYEKPQKAFNAMLGASIAAFTVVSFYVWKNDILSLRLAGPPKWYTHRKVGKGLGEID